MNKRAIKLFSAPQMTKMPHGNVLARIGMRSRCFVDKFPFHDSLRRVIQPVDKDNDQSLPTRQCNAIQKDIKRVNKGSTHSRTPVEGFLLLHSYTCTDHLALYHCVSL